MSDLIVDGPADLDGPSRFTRWARNLREDLFAPGEGLPTLVGSLFVLGVITAFFVLAYTSDPDTWVPIIVLVLLALVSLPICGWLAGRPRDGRLYKLLVIGMLIKLLMAGPRYGLSEGYYEGEGDSGRYHQAGVYFIENLEKGDWDIAPAELAEFPKETRLVGYVVGILYTALGTSYFGGFVAFSWLSWIGIVCFFRAFRIAYPNAPPYFLATLMAIVPSLLFWPSSLGKDAIMVFLLGVFTLGAARVLSSTKVWLGVVWIGLSGFGMMQIRPHLLLVAAVAMLASTLARPDGGVGLRGAVLRFTLVLLMIPAIILGVGQLDGLLGSEGDQSISQSLDTTVDRTQIGGSAFEARPVRGPQDIPMALLTVLYRPFLFEANSVAVMIAALESLALLCATVVSARWIWKIGPTMYHWPFAAFCGAYVFAFVIAFSNIANAGILARQRVQMFPLLLLLVAATREYYRLELAKAESEQDSLEPGVVVDTTARPSSTTHVSTTTP